MNSKHRISTKVEQHAIFLRNIEQLSRLRMTKCQFARSTKGDTNGAVLIGSPLFVKCCLAVGSAGATVNNHRDLWLGFLTEGNKFTHSPQTTLVCKILFASFMIKRRHEPNSNCLCRASESWWNGFQSDPSRYQLNRVPRLPSAALKYWPHGFRDQNPVFIQTKIPNALDKFSISFQIRRTCAPTPCRAPQVD